MTTNDAKRVISSHQDRGNAVELGPAVMFEITRETALDRLCCSIETLGGQVLHISERVQATGRATGRATQTIYTVVCILA